MKAQSLYLGCNLSAEKVVDDDIDIDEQLVSLNDETTLRSRAKWFAKPERESSGADDDEVLQ